MYLESGVGSINIGVSHLGLMISQHESNRSIGLILRQRLIETCKATADFAIFSGFGWHRRGDPLKSKKINLFKVAIFGLGIFFVFRLSPIF